MKLLIILSVTMAIVGASNLVTAINKGENNIRNQNSADKEFSYHVRLLLRNSNNKLSLCSGSLIDNEWILTAAYCTVDTKEALIYLGANHRESVKPTYRVTNKNFIIHSDWNNDTLQNDIALIKIPYTDYSDHVQPIKLPSAKSFYDTFTGDNVITPGWSHILFPSDNIDSNLQHTLMNVVIPNSQCRKYYDGVLSSSNICSAAYDGFTECVSADTGTPLVLKNSKIQIGLVSISSDNSCKNNIPRISTRITHYLSWIEKMSGVSS